MIRCLRLYAAPLVVLLEAGITQLTGNPPAVIVLRLVVFAAALAISIHELRDERRRRQY